MKRLFALAIAAILIAGCQYQTQPREDPFHGRQRIEPPGTGCISPQSPTPYYNARPDAGTLRQGTPSSPMPIESGRPAASDGTPLYSPPSGGYPYRGDSRIRTDRADSNRLGARAPTGPGDRAETRVAGRDTIVRVLPPRPKSKVRRASAIEPVEPAQQASKSVVVPASGTASQTGDEVVKAEFTSQSDYGYDPEYRWVRGKLEYSQIDRQWKLRYIPIDGETDKFGGSVVLSDRSKLAGCERGDLIEVRGELGDGDVKKGYAPVYEVAEVVAPQR